MYLYKIMGSFLELLYAALLIYFLYKLIVNLILPVSKTASQMKSKINEMNRAQAQQNQQQFKPKARKTASPDTTTTDAEYIDFEEVK